MFNQQLQTKLIVIIIQVTILMKLKTMVEVTKFNFEKILPVIEESIEKSSFIAIDSEFTGLEIGSEYESSLFDNMNERYRKLKARASSILPSQIGISLFTRSKTENKYNVETYIFYVRPHMIGSSDRRFICQASSVDFLNSYDFDFNKFLREGIPYLNEEELNQLKKEISDGTVSSSHIQMMDFRSKREMDMAINKIFSKSLDDKNNQSESSEKLTIEKEIFSFEKDKRVHEYFQVCELRRKYPSLWIWCDDQKINVRKGFSRNSKKDTKKLEEMKRSEDERLLDHFLGFTKVFRCIRKSCKPIVGHNLLLDLLLFFQNFYKPLPETYIDFKKELHQLFPKIFDTRHIWLNVKKFYKLKDISTRCGLFDLHEMFKNPTDTLSTIFAPIIKHTNCENYSSTEFPHEAGYDSYVTGWVFLKICHLLALYDVKIDVLITPQSFKEHLAAVKHFENKINLSHSRIRFIDLINNDPVPIEAQVLHIKVRNKNKILNHAQLSQLFEKYGMVEFKLNGNKKEAVLAVGSPRGSKEILNDFKGDKYFIVTPYSIFRHSPLVNSTLWLTSLGALSAIGFYVFKYSSKTY